HAGDVGGVRQHGDDDVRGRDERGEIAGRRGASLDQHGDLRRNRIESRYGKSLADKRRCHRPAHAAEPDEADPFASYGHRSSLERMSQTIPTRGCRANPPTQLLSLGDFLTFRAPEITSMLENAPRTCMTAENPAETPPAVEQP